MATQRHFVVVARSSSGARFKADEQFIVSDFPSQFGPVRVRFRTRYADEGFEAAVPRELYAEVRGTAPTLESALEPFTHSARLLMPLVALAANAPVDELEPHIAFEVTPGVAERDFFESHIPDETGIPRQGRRVPPAVGQLLEAVAGNASADRLHRALVHYAEALRHWRPGREVPCVSHLWMAGEALTPVALRSELARTGLMEDALAQSWDLFADAPERRKVVRRAKLEAEARRRLIFGGDSDTYRHAKAASDGLEHSFMNLGAVLEHARLARDPAASLIRSAVLTLGGISAEGFEALTSEKYARPLESWRYARHFRGRLKGPASTELAAAGEEYPRVRWESTVTGFKVGAEGYDVAFEEKFTAVFADGLELAPESVQIWGPKKEPRYPEDDA